LPPPDSSPSGLPRTALQGSPRVARATASRQAAARRARTRRTAFARGLRAVAPALLATGTWGLVTGVAMVRVGLDPLQALGMTLLVFAGSAQLAALPLMAAAAPVGVVLLAACVVNLRFVIFSAGLQPYFRHLSLGRRLLMGYLTTDFGFVVFVGREVARRRATGPASSPARRSAQTWFFLGGAAAGWVVWQSASILGIVLAARVPAAWGLEFAATLALIALTVPMVRGTPAAAGAAAAGVVAIVAAPLPLKLGLVLAVAVGIAVAMGVEIALERRAAGPDGAA